MLNHYGEMSKDIFTFAVEKKHHYWHSLNKLLGPKQSFQCKINLQKLSSTHKDHLRLVKVHAECTGNQLVDQLAEKGSSQLPPLPDFSQAQQITIPFPSATSKQSLISF
jgi:ribonuclease HI